MSAMLLEVWWGLRNGLEIMSGRSRSSRFDTEYILVVSSDSSKPSGGRMPGIALASRVLPLPGGPIIRML
jgi:hypothetical protein